MNKTNKTAYLTRFSIEKSGKNPCLSCLPCLNPFHMSQKEVIIIIGIISLNI